MSRAFLLELQLVARIRVFPSLRLFSLSAIPVRPPRLFWIQRFRISHLCLYSEGQGTQLCFPLFAYLFHGFTVARANFNCAPVIHTLLGRHFHGIGFAKYKRLLGGSGRWRLSVNERPVLHDEVERYLGVIYILLRFVPLLLPF